jgi:OmpA-OmpF porin, OOP family
MMRPFSRKTLPFLAPLRNFWLGAALAFAAALGPTASGLAQENPFAGGWVLQPGSSALRFQSVKNQSKVESSSFASFSGSIDSLGRVELKVLLDSVDTKIDLRNVRMRFLFFETFLYPEATLRLQLTREMVEDLSQVRRKILTLPFTLELHGIKRELSTEVALTLITDDLVAVSSSAPLTIAAADFALMEGVAKLEAAANVKLVPSGSVTFDLLFGKNTGTATTPAVAPTAPATTNPAVPSAPTEPAKPASAALETAGNFSLAACIGRFEILSRTGNINFAAGSARLHANSTPLLDSLFDIVSRCPGLRIEIAGHTDSDGSLKTNQRLSERRAASVAAFLTRKGLSPDAFVVAGYGETRPVARNDSHANKARNRRIEFSVLNN